MALFEGLVTTEDGEPVALVQIGSDQFYVIDDHGFRRHVSARDVDRVVFGQFMEQLDAHRDEASEAMLRLMGSDDLFAKAMVDSALSHIDAEQVLDQTLPAEARQWLGMMGFQVILDIHGEVLRVEMPAGEAPEDED